MLASTSRVALDNGSLSNKLGSFAIALDKREFRLKSENVSLRRSERLLALKRSRPSRRRLVSSGMEVIVMSEYAAARGGASGGKMAAAASAAVSELKGTRKEYKAAASAFAFAAASSAAAFAAASARSRSPHFKRSARLNLCEPRVRPARMRRRR